MNLIGFVVIEANFDVTFRGLLDDITLGLDKFSFLLGPGRRCYFCMCDVGFVSILRMTGSSVVEVLCCFVHFFLRMIGCCGV